MKLKLFDWVTRLGGTYVLLKIWPSQTQFNDPPAPPMRLRVMQSTIPA